MTKIAVFGSAFNPPSFGHKSIIDSLDHFDRILLVPAISHAWGKEMLNYNHRCQLVDAFLSDLDNPKVVRSTVEESLYKPEHSVATFDVLEALEQSFPNADFTFVIGPDNLFNFSKFYQAEEIAKRWSILMCPEKMPIRSTDIRLCAINGGELEELTTPAVVALLKLHQWYR
jgi:nicotinate-nucleotide adenylyltransferase